MQKSVTIAKQFNGPPTSGNGGYVSGLIAEGLYEAGKNGGVEVSLHVPPPLDTDLLLLTGGGESRLLQGDKVIGTAKPKELAMELPDFPLSPELIGTPVNPEGRFQPFDECFVCGTARSEGDGLCLHSEAVKNREGFVATRWNIHPSFAETGIVGARFIWSALDCPGYFACAYGEAALLARFNAEIYKAIPADATPWVFGWTIGGAKEGRKRRCGTAVVGTDGTLYAAAEGLWIIVDVSKMAGGQ